MARRRRVTAPSEDDIAKIEAEFRGETTHRPGGAMAPISQVVAESAAQSQMSDPQARADQARDRKDAEDMRSAAQEGRVIVDLPLEEIEDIAIVRDRIVLDANELTELKNSISAHGLRLPIEVFRQPEGSKKPYGLISGYRRLRAIRELHALTEFEKYATIRTLIREPDALGGAMTAMVEENEIRAGLSHFERGRICVIAAEQGVFGSVEEAVNALFAAGSKAKRSKIRSFAVIFEELGDLLEYPEKITEKQGLRVCNTLRSGWETQFREALGAVDVLTWAQEIDILETVCAEFDALQKPDPSRGGRPKTRASVPRRKGDMLRLSSGMVLQQEKDPDGFVIRFTGRGVTQPVVDDAMAYLAKYLDNF